MSVEGIADDHTEKAKRGSAPVRMGAIEFETISGRAVNESALLKQGIVGIEFWSTDRSGTGIAACRA